MKIGIDARPLQLSQQFQGIGFYSRRLIEALSRVEGEEELVLFHLPEWTPGNLGLGTARQVSSLPIWRPFPEGRLSFLWDQFLTPIDVAKGRVALFHSLMINNLSFFCPSPSVLSLLDTIPLVFSEEYMKTGLKIRTLYRFAKRSDAIITISKHSKEDIVRFLGVPPDRVFVTYLAADEGFGPEEDKRKIEMVRQKFGVRGRYFFYAGGFQNPDPRKNVELLVRLMVEMKRKGEEVMLVLAGKGGSYSDKILSDSERMGVADRVMHAGYVSSEDLRLLYSGAEIFLFPSRYEGFGLPVLEAMACGTPVVAFATSSIPEVAGDAACLVPPGDEEGFLKTCIQASRNRDLLLHLSRAGLEQAAHFSWKRTALETLQVYGTLIHGRKRR